MPTLHLGVIDQLYSNANAFQLFDASMRRALGENPFQTTGDVAQHLEARYGVMGAFMKRHETAVGDALAKGVQGALENVLMGRLGGDPFAGACSAIDAKFKGFLATGEIEGMGIAGVPTKAAIQRRSSRFKKKKANARRPSFIDSGLYMGSFKSWVTP